MQRDSKQRSKPGTTPQASGGAPSPAVDQPDPKQPGRERRPARLELKSAVAGPGEPGTRGAPGARGTPGAQPAKPVKAAKPGAKAQPKTKRPRLSALDAAAVVLGGLTSDEARQGITAQDLVGRMAKQKLWTSPGGKTPQATLYAAMVREAGAKGAAARFRRVSRGHFVAAAASPRKRARP